MGDERHSIDPRSLQSNTIQMLHDGPKTTSELKEGGGGVTPLMRQTLVSSLQRPSRHAGTKKRGGGGGYRRDNAVHYLYGDERRAMRRFIETDPEYVESCMEDSSNPLSKNWNGWQWQMLCEEWQFWKLENE